MYTSEQASVDSVFVSLGYPQGDTHEAMVKQISAANDIINASEPVVVLLKMLFDAHTQLCNSVQPDGAPDWIVNDLHSFMAWLEQYDELYHLSLERVLEEGTRDTGKHIVVNGERCFQYVSCNHYKVLLRRHTVAYTKALHTWAVGEESDDIMMADVRFLTVDRK